MEQSRNPTLNMMLKELMKNLEKRIHLWFILAVILLLLDEYLKEGYLVKPKDILKPLTHEQILTATTIIYVLILLILKLKKKKPKKRRK